MLSYPPLEGEGRLTWSAAKCETGWVISQLGDRLKTIDCHPTPPLISELAATLPLQEGKVFYTRCIDTETFGPFLMVW